jgi:DNA-binding transcriptional regulator GbsR (MarR family)
MPGARLTQQERQQIAIWLNDRLAYAEIARRLGRPTSTISREVTRGGNLGNYLPDRAQQAAARRAQRRKPTRATQQTAEPVRGFVEHFATLLAATGLPRMTARVFVCLLTTDSGGLTSADLVRQLQVSPASVSKAIAYLETMELVMRSPDPGRRRERYIIVDDVWLRAWRADTGAHAKIADAAKRGTEIFGADTPTGTRLAKMGQFFGWLTGQMSASSLGDATAHDALTVLAALVYTTRPLTADELAESLNWPDKRVTDALDAIDEQPAIADPLTLTSTGTGTYTITTRPDRLSTTQQQALRAYTASRH